MIKSFPLDLEGVHFQFNTLSTKALQAFQVYVKHDSKPLRFHMQLKDESFYITDPTSCPKEYLAIEQQLSDAIFKSQE